MIALSVAWQNMLLGVAAAQYWRKDFRCKSHTHNVCMLIWAAFGSIDTGRTLLAVIVAVISADVLGALRKNHLMCMLVMLLSHIETHSAWVAALAVWVQMARRPLWLKLRLRELRIALGPVYVIAASQMLSEHGCCLKFLSTGLVVAAGSVLRPDNASTAEMFASLRLLPRGLLQDQLRTKCHGCLMAISVSLLVLMAI